MSKLIESILGFVVLAMAGQCVADIPTGEELFEQQQGEPKLVVGADSESAIWLTTPPLPC